MSSPTLVLFRKECRVALRSTATWCVFAACASLVGLFFAFALREAAGGPATLAELFCTPLALAAPEVSDGRLVLFSTHDAGLVRAAATRVLFLERGRLAADTTSIPIAGTLADWFDRWSNAE